MSFNSIILFFEHVAGFFQLVTAHLDDFVLTDPVRTVGEIVEYFTNSFGYLFP